MQKITEKYLAHIATDSNHRYKSWEYCFQAFSDNKFYNPDILALHLGFYLASWGMYRGSSGLLWKDYKIHTKPVSLILANYDLRSLSIETIPNPNQILHLFQELKKYYSGIEYFKDDVSSGHNYVTATDTLLSKILLGTLGCMPAFDRYFNLGIFGKEYSTINESTLHQIWKKFDSFEFCQEIDSAQKWIAQITGVIYPPMKIIDMYYWQIGFDSIKP